MATTCNDDLKEFPISYSSLAVTPVIPDGIVVVDTKQIEVKQALVMLIEYDASFVFTFARAGSR